jgi:hypothetical protein
MAWQHLGIGSDLCQDQPDSVVEWMRTGRWSKDMDFGEGSAGAGLPAHAGWFQDNGISRTLRMAYALWVCLQKKSLGSWAAIGIVSSIRISSQERPNARREFANGNDRAT